MQGPRPRLAVCVPLAVAVIALSMVPARQFTGWQWVSLLLTAPVAVWGAWPLHRAALAGLGHGAATMDTLVSLAVARRPAGRSTRCSSAGQGRPDGMPFAFTFSAASGMTLYFEAAAGLPPPCWPPLPGGQGPGPVGVGADRPGRARRQERRRAARRDRAPDPGRRAGRGELFVVRQQKIAADGIVAEGSSTVDSSLVTASPCRWRSARAAS